MMLQVELFFAPECSRCARAKARVSRVIAGLADSAVEYRERNVVEAIDDAVRLGVVSTPTIVVNGEVAFTTLPDERRLREVLVGLLGSENSGPGPRRLP